MRSTGSGNMAERNVWYLDAGISGGIRGLEIGYCTMVGGDRKTFESLEPTLHPLFACEVGPRFLTWGAAHSQAWAAGDAQTELTTDGRRYHQKTRKYPARTLSILRRKLEAASDDPRLRSFLDETGCLGPLQPVDPQ